MKKLLILSLPIGTFFAVLIGCSKDQDSLDERLALLSLETLGPVEHPANNPTSQEKVLLGKLLFWDPILSGELDVSCATCHHPGFGYGDGLDLSIGVAGQGLGPNRIETDPGRIPRVGRNAPTVLNAAYNGLLSQHQAYSPEDAPMFWDSRALSLEEQALGPPQSFNEMRGDAYTIDQTYAVLVSRLREIPEYVNLFRGAFGGNTNSVNEENIGKAIAAFERTIVSNNSPYDRYVRGDLNSLTDDQKRGMELFFGKAQCGNCHNGPMFSDFAHHNLGIEANPSTGADAGLNGQYQFRTPTLRNIALTAPYMHNGTQRTLREVMEFYNEGVSRNDAASGFAIAIQPLGLTDLEMQLIIRFMEALTDNNFDRSVPPRVPSNLKVGGNI